VTPRLTHAVWAAASLPEARAFRRALGDVEGSQRRLLARIVRAGARTAYGEAHGFGAIRTAEAFRRRVPLVEYDAPGSNPGRALAPFVDRIAAGERRVLTAEPVRLLEPTSGSTAATKLIPYTAALQRDLRRAIAPWMADLYTRHPGVGRGPHYWALSPVARAVRHTEAGVPIGFEDDGAYLGAMGRLARATFAVPPEARHVSDLDAWRYVTLRLLVARRDLALVSVWSPTFLTLLLDRLPGWADRLAHDLRLGALSPPTPLPPDLDARLTRGLAPDPRRAAEVAAALAEADPAARHARLWPRLAVVSAWADAYAARYADALAAQLPHAAFQPKGLLATEGVVSIPYGGGEGAVLAVRSHVFEFLGEDGAVRWAHELEAGQVYEVVLTTSGGLYRYRLRDLVEVVGFEREAPRLRFLGKASWVSDRVGEKLDERHVRAALDGYDLAFALVAFDARREAYTLFVRSDAEAAHLTAIAEAIEARLRDNVHYAYARDLGQLGPLGVFRIRGDAPAAYQAHQARLGRRVGDVKPACLDRADGWADAFEGAYLGS